MSCAHVGTTDIFARGVLCHREYLQEEPTFPVLWTLFMGPGSLACAGKVFLEDPQPWAQLVPDAGPCDNFSQVLLALGPTQTPWDDKQTAHCVHSALPPSLLPLCTHEPQVLPLVIISWGTCLGPSPSVLPLVVISWGHASRPISIRRYELGCSSALFLTALTQKSPRCLVLGVAK